MTMKKLLDAVLKKHEWTRYRLAKEVGLSTQAMDHLYLRNPKGVRIAVLIRLQEVSGYSVERFWKMLKDEHGIDSDSD